MPKIYLLVRYDSNEDVEPRYRIHDISMTGLPDEVKHDTSLKIHTLLVEVEDEAAVRSTTYEIAAIIKKQSPKANAGAELKNNHDIEIVGGSFCYEVIYNQLHEISSSAQGTDQKEQTVHSPLIGQLYVRKDLESNSFSWYRLVTMDVDDLSTQVGVVAEDEGMNVDGDEAIGNVVG